MEHNGINGIDFPVIAVFCYKRRDKLKSCIDSLLKNPESKDSVVIFFSDGYKGESDKNLVYDTRNYIDEIKGFKRIVKISRTRNFGLLHNFKSALSYLTKHYESFIVVEDDLIVSTNFLRYMTDALNFYRNSKEIFCVTGYSFPLKYHGYYKYDTLTHNRLCVYGWGSWSDRTSQVSWDLNKISDLIQQDRSFKKILNKEGTDLYRMLKKTISGKIVTWDILLQVHIAQRKMKVVYPVKSKTTNIGFDSESTHTYGYNYLATSLDESRQNSFNFCNACLTDPHLIEQLRRPYTLPYLVSRKIINSLLHFRRK